MIFDDRDEGIKSPGLTGPAGIDRECREPQASDGGKDSCLMVKGAERTDHPISETESCSGGSRTVQCQLALTVAP